MFLASPWKLVQIKTVFISYFPNRMLLNIHFLHAEFVLECSNTYMKVLPCQDPVHPHRPTRDPFPAPKGHLFSLPFTGLNCKRHYWDTTFFNGLTIVKVPYRSNFSSQILLTLHIKLKCYHVLSLCYVYVHTAKPTAVKLSYWDM